MLKLSTATLTAAALMLSATAALAGPCDTGSTKAKSPNEQAANPKSSDTDQSSKNLAGGQQPASPGTVGAMNNVGVNQGVGQKQASDTGKEDPASKNLAGGQQPASPGTVGAMNNAGSDQKVAQGKQDDC